MKKIVFASIILCLSFVFSLGISALPRTDDTAEIIKKAERHFEKAVELIGQLMYDEAIGELQQVITLVPETNIANDACYWIGQAYFKAGQLDDALITFEQLMKENPESAIIPVTQLMVNRVQAAKENEKLRTSSSNETDIGKIIDPKTGIKYTKIKTFLGKSDVIEWTPFAHLSPNGRFLLYENKIIPMDGSDPFDLVDMPATRGSWSPDGKNIAFISNDSTISMLLVSPETGRASGPVKKILSGNYSDIEDISWSPNGEKIAFSICDNKEYPDIRTLSVKDGSLNKITNDSIAQLNPIWSPDGSAIVYRDLLRGICSSPGEGGTPRILIDKNKHRGPNWTLDGKWLFFDAQASSPWTSLYFVRLSDKMEQTINPPDKVGGFLSWTADGEKALFYRSSYNIIWGMRVASASGGPSFEPVPSLPAYGARWHSDSKMIFVQGQDKKGDVGMRIVPLAGEESFLLDMDISLNGKPFPYCISPDGKKLLFKIEKDDKTDLYVVPISVTDARTTEPAVKIIDGWSRGGGWNVNLAWSPDGSKLAVVNKGDLWISDLSGEKLLQITNTPEEENWPAWSPDGTMLSHKMNYDASEAHTEYRIIPAQGGKPLKIFKDCKNFSWCWLADSKAFVIISHGVIMIHPIGDRDPRQIFDLKNNNLVDASEPCCSPDGKYLAFIGESKNGDNQSKEWQLYRVSVQDGELTRLATDNTNDQDDLYSISWSPDGKWIHYLYSKMGKVRPAGTLWEADLAVFLQKIPE